jgi:hypothetical protein
MIGVDIANIQDEQDRNLRRIAALQPGGELGEAVQLAGIRVHRYVVAITHVDTGALRAAHRLDYQEDGGEALVRIYIDPSAVNPHDQLPSEYGPYEHDRGGEHAFYQRGIDEEGYSAIAASSQLLAIALVDA